MKTTICDKCSQQYNINLSANLIVICTKCKCGIYSECEYGYGPITPCDIYLGDERAGKIDGNINYRLDSSRLNVHTALKKGYANLEVYKEATDIISSKLNEGPLT